MTQHSLTDFDTSTEVPPATQPDEQSSTEEPTQAEEQETVTEEDQQNPLNAVDLPNVFTWERTTTQYKQATVVRPKTDDLVQLGGDASIFPHTVAYVVDGLDNYLSETESRTIETPTSYKALQEDFTPLITGRTCSVGSGRLGITRDFLEAAIRVATGGGRYRTDDLTIHIGDPIGFIVEYDGHAFLFETKDMDSFDLEETPEVAVESEPREINGLSIIEDVPRMQDALEQFLTAVREYCDITIDTHQAVSESNHVFEAADGMSVKISGSQLRSLDSPLASYDEIVGEHVIEPDIGDPMTVEVPDVPTEPGNERNLGGAVIGYRVGHRNKPGGIMGRRASSSITRISDEARFYLYTFTVRVTEKDHESASEPYYRVKISDHDVIVAKYTIKSGSFNVTPSFRNRISS